MDYEIEPLEPGSELELIHDGDGVAVIGDKNAVEQFLSSHQLASRDLGLARISNMLNTGSQVAQTGVEVSKNYGRWVQLTEKSAQQLKTYNTMKGSTSGVSRAVVMHKGRTKGILEFVKTTPKNMLTNPALLTGAAGLMSQLAMQEAMDEITDYLALIDAKVNDVLRAQKDAALAEMIGVDLAVQEAFSIREEVGRVSEITWSKIQSTPVIIGSTQAYALRQLDALAEKLESTSNVGELAEILKGAGATVLEWLSVLARCFQLQDAIAIIELDRVLDAAPDELERHRTALRTARRNRIEMFARSTDSLLTRIEAAAGHANRSVLFHPIDARSVVDSGKQAAENVIVFQEHIKITTREHSLEARRWRDAVADVRDKVVSSSADGLDAVMKLSVDTAEWAKETAEKVSDEITERTRRDEPELEIEDEVPWVLQDRESQ